MAGQIDTYNQEIFNFLRTVTIKFEPFAYSMGSEIMESEGIIDPHGSWNPYYQNLIGEYSSAQKLSGVMTVTAVEDGSTVVFSKELVKTHPRTMALYTVDTDEYKNLEDKYPQYRGLIRTIAYPVGTMDDVLNAPNLSLIGYDDSYLESNERESIVTCLKTFLQMVRERWYIDEYRFENLYPITFWGVLWSLLPMVLATQRYLNIRTAAAHSFHVWEFLKSRGLGDYRDVLTHKQSMWLYRNIDYIRKNQGKNSNLKILAENLLPEVAVSLLYVDMYQETATRQPSELITNPQFRFFNLLTNDPVKTENMSLLNTSLVEMNLEHKNTSDFVNETEIKLATQRFNVLSTKFLEFKKESIDTRTTQLLANFFLDSLMYNLAANALGFNCELKDPLGSSKYELSISKVIALWWYCLRKNNGDNPESSASESKNTEVISTKKLLKAPLLKDSNEVQLPTYYTVHIPVRRIAGKIPKTIKVLGITYQMSEFLDIDELISAFEITNDTYLNQENFMLHLVNQYKTLKTLSEKLQNNSSLPFHLAVKTFLDKILVEDKVSITIDPNATDFTSLIAEDDSLATIVAELEDITEGKSAANAYNAVASACFDALFPLNSELIKEEIGNSFSVEEIYTAIRDLFIALGSYNVTYLETDRTFNKYLRIDPALIQMLHFYEYEFNKPWDLLLQHFPVTFKMNHEPTFEELYVDLFTSVTASTTTVEMLEDIARVDISLDMHFSWNTYVPLINLLPQEHTTKTQPRAWSWNKYTLCFNEPFVIPMERLSTYKEG